MIPFLKPETLIIEIPRRSSVVMKMLGILRYEYYTTKLYLSNFLFIQYQLGSLGPERKAGHIPRFT